MYNAYININGIRKKVHISEYKEIVWSHVSAVTKITNYVKDNGNSLAMQVQLYSL